jgi:SAM-dependent methyltransferase
MDDLSALAPPAELNFVGAGQFAAIGQELVDLFVRECGLKPYHRVLDVGCGIGRVALPLAHYLSRRGRYDGFDIVDVGIDWCRKNITPRRRNFRFVHADVYNRGYNPGGRFDAHEYRFPYRSGRFDFVFLTSVFTHLLPADLENYLAEIARVLKVGGRCFITFLLRNEDMLRISKEGRALLYFNYEGDGYWTCNEEVPEDAVCYEEDYVLGLYDKLGLRPDEPVRYGTWCGRPHGLTTQDAIIATKVRSVRPPLSERWEQFKKRVGYWWSPPPPREQVWQGGAGRLVERARRYAKDNERAA